MSINELYSPKFDRTKHGSLFLSRVSVSFYKEGNFTEILLLARVTNVARGNSKISKKCNLCYPPDTQGFTKKISAKLVQPFSQIYVYIYIYERRALILRNVFLQKAEDVILQ